MLQCIGADYPLPRFPFWAQGCIFDKKSSAKGIYLTKPVKMCVVGLNYRLFSENFSLIGNIGAKIPQNCVRISSWSGNGPWPRVSFRPNFPQPRTGAIYPRVKFSEYSPGPRCRPKRRAVQRYQRINYTTKKLKKKKKKNELMDIMK